MGKENEISAIFNPRRVRAPSVVVTGDSPNGPLGGFLNHHQIQHSDSVTSSQHGDPPEHTIICGTTGCNTPTPTAEGMIIMNALPVVQPVKSSSRWGRCRGSCCSDFAKKMYFGFCVTILVTISWVGATHAIKFLYLCNDLQSSDILKYPHELLSKKFEKNATTGIQFINTKDRGKTIVAQPYFNAPFFASWFCSNFSILFFPIYLLGRVAMRKCDGPGEILGEVFRGFRDRGFTVGRYINRCMTFAMLWLVVQWLYIQSLKALLSTEVTALFATNVACVYLLSWVILHEQFVGVRIVAVILCNTGTALLAYMDGITGTPTFGGVVMAALAAGGYAVFKVMFKKLMGDPPIGQIAFTFSFLGFLNASLLWPICIALYLSGIEVMPWDLVPWVFLLIASVLLLGGC